MERRTLIKSYAATHSETFDMSAMYEILAAVLLLLNLLLLSIIYGTFTGNPECFFVIELVEVMNTFRNDGNVPLFFAQFRYAYLSFAYYSRVSMCCGLWIHDSLL